MTDFMSMPLSELLKNREVFRVFSDEFQKDGWLDASVLLYSEGSIEDLYTDKIVPKEVLDKIVNNIKII